MANHPSAEKRIRQTARRTEVNRARMSRIRTFVKKVETAIASGNKDAAKKHSPKPRLKCSAARARAWCITALSRANLSRLSARIKAL